MIQNYYTAITRARFGAKLWTEDRDRLVDKLKQRSGEKTSSLQALGRVERDSVKGRASRQGDRWNKLRDEQRAERDARKDRLRAEQEERSKPPRDSLAAYFADRAQAAAKSLDQWLATLLERARGGIDRATDRVDGQPGQAPPTPQPEPVHSRGDDHGGGHDR